MIFYNFKGYGSPDFRTQFSAMRIKQGQIVATGHSLKDLGKTGDGCVDLRGLTVIPGFHDAHIHLSHLGRLTHMLDLKGVQTFYELKQVLSKYVLPVLGDRSKWLVGRGLNFEMWQEETPCSGATLDALKVDRPLAIKSVDGHAYIVNRQALEQLGLSTVSSDGIFRDEEMKLLAPFVENRDSSLIKADIMGAQTQLISLGITSIDEAHVSQEELTAFIELDASGLLDLRCHLWLDGDSVFDNWVSGRKKPLRGENLAIASVKLFADGALGSGGAVTSFDQGGSHFGSEIWDMEGLTARLKRIMDSGFQPIIHAIGDRAVGTVCQALERIDITTQVAPFRPRLEHVQIINTEDILRIKKMGVISSMQPCHYYTDKKWLFSKFPFLRETALRLYAWQDLLNAGNGILPLGTDAPVESPHPLVNIQMAVMERQDGQSLTIEQAVKGYTFDGQYANFLEKKRGRLLPGFDADFVILSEDIFATDTKKIDQIEIVDTVIAGKSFLAGFQY